jgi:hypothetical protein
MTGLVSRTRRVATSAESRHDPYPTDDSDGDERESNRTDANQSLAAFGAGVAEEQEAGL